MGERSGEQIAWPPGVRGLGNSCSLVAYFMPSARLLTGRRNDRSRIERGSFGMTRQLHRQSEQSPAPSCLAYRFGCLGRLPPTCSQRRRQKSYDWSLSLLPPALGGSDRGQALSIAL